MATEVAKKGKKIFTLIRDLMHFYEAEDYHQNYYEERGSSNPYCNIIPGKIAKMKDHFKDDVTVWSKTLYFLNLFHKVL